MPKTEETIKDSGHIHRWSLQKDGSSKCIASYNGHACIKILVSETLHEQILAEWENYYQLCRQSDAHEDYKQMKIAFKYRDKEKMAKILERVKKRCRVNPNYQGYTDQAKYLFNEGEYMTPPLLPDPMNPRRYYVTQ